MIYYEQWWFVVKGLQGMWMYICCDAKFQNDGHFDLFCLFGAAHVLLTTATSSWLFPPASVLSILREVIEMHFEVTEFSRHIALH